MFVIQLPPDAALEAATNRASLRPVTGPFYVRPRSAPATGCAPLATRRPLRTWSGVVGRPGAWSPRAAAPWLAASSPHATRRALSGSCRATAAAREASVTSDVASAPVVLYNTLSRKKEEFTPREGQGNKVSMYVCGVTGGLRQGKRVLMYVCGVTGAF